MKKLTALFTIVALLVCMFTFAPTASAYQLPNGQGECVSGSTTLTHYSGSVTIYYDLTCHNGWLDGTYGSDYVEACMSASQVFSCSASIDLTANYIKNGEHVSEDEYDTTSTLSTYDFSVSIFPATDLLSSGSASFYVISNTHGSMSDSLSASCPTALK